MKIGTKVGQRCPGLNKEGVVSCLYTKRERKNELEFRLILFVIKQTRKNKVHNDSKFLF